MLFRSHLPLRTTAVTFQIAYATETAGRAHVDVDSLHVSRATRLRFRRLRGGLTGDDDDGSFLAGWGGGCGGSSGSVSGLTFAIDSRGTSLRTFRYLWRAATYSLTLRSSSRDSCRRVLDNCRLRSVFAIASAGLCSLLYSLSNSSTRTSFLACCIILSVDRLVSPTLVQAVPTESRPSE